MVKFDLSSISELKGAKITKATLSMYAEKTHPSNFPGGTKTQHGAGGKTVNYSVKAWDESNVTWAGLGYAQGNGTAAPKGTQLAAGGGSVNVWDNFDVTAAVTSWITNPSGNIGLDIHPNNYGTYAYATDYCSSEHATSANRPKLVIEYSSTSTQFALTVNATNGTVAKSPDAAKYDSAKVVSLTATPAKGYMFDSWSGAITGTTNPASVTMNAAKTVTANFKLLPVDSSYLYIDQKTITVKSATSQETTDEDGKSSNMLDGSTTTIWHSEYSATTAKFPHELVFDLAKSYGVSGIEYTGRNAGTNGNVKGYEVYVSKDGATWGTAVKTGTFTDVATAQKALFTSTEGRYVKFVAVSSQNGADFAAASEFNVLWDAKFVATPTYALTVSGGTGAGSFEMGKSVAISATVPSGKEFVKWSSTPTGIVADTTKLSTTVTMPGSAATVTAVFKDAVVPTFAVTVTGGTGSGSYKAGEIVQIIAEVPEGKNFVKWNCSKAGLVSDSTNDTISITIPSEPITLTAVFEDQVGVLGLMNRSISPVVLCGTLLTVNHSVQNGVVRIVGFNGRLISEQVVSMGQTVDLGGMDLPSGIYLVQVTGRNYNSPTMRFVVK